MSGLVAAGASLGLAAALRVGDWVGLKGGGLVPVMLMQVGCKIEGEMHRTRALRRWKAALGWAEVGRRVIAGKLVQAVRVAWGEAWASLEAEEALALVVESLSRLVAACELRRSWAARFLRPM